MHYIDRKTNFNNKINYTIIFLDVENLYIAKIIATNCLTVSKYGGSKRHNEKRASAFILAAAAEAAAKHWTGRAIG